MKLIRYFDSFLTETVNLKQARLDLLDLRVDSIVGTIGTDDSVGRLLVGHTPQGSWAHRTIIEPLPGDEFDADILLQLEEQAAWEASPKRYITEVLAALRRSSEYGDKVNRKTRCVRVRYADDCHVDVVPYIIRSDGSEVIVNYVEDEFEETNPKGFTDWMREKDTLANSNLRRVIRLLKYLRDYKNTFTAPSVILTTLLGERVQALETDTLYADVPTTLLTLITDLNAWLQANVTMPVIEDPSCPGISFNHRWDEAQYANFRNQIRGYATRIRSAYEEADKARSLRLWQEIFGDEFKEPVAKASITESLPPSKLDWLPSDRAPDEVFIQERYGIALRYTARIDARVSKMAGWRSGPLRGLGKLNKGRWIFFKAVTNAPPPYRAFWKVRNTGAEAKSLAALRGQLLPDDGSMSRDEKTLYTGNHYVEFYVVKDEQVVASDHVTVSIR